MEEDIIKHIEGAVERVQVAELLNKAQVTVIDSEQAVDIASVLLSNIKQVEDLVEAKRLSFTKPLNESLKRINASFKAISEPLAVAKFTIKAKILIWTQEQHSIEMARLRALREEQDAKAKLNEVLDLPVEEVLPTKVQALDNKIGNVQMVKRWTWEVEDFDKIPNFYLEVNTTHVGEAVRNGIREIPGIRIYQEESISIVKR